jgi:hypothetical protein
MPLATTLAQLISPFFRVLTLPGNRIPYTDRFKSKIASTVGLRLSEPEWLPKWHLQRGCHSRHCCRDPYEKQCACHLFGPTYQNRGRMRKASRQRLPFPAVFARRQRTDPHRFPLRSRKTCMDRPSLEGRRYLVPKPR